MVNMGLGHFNSRTIKSNRRVARGVAQVGQVGQEPEGGGHTAVSAFTLPVPGGANPFLAKVNGKDQPPSQQLG